MAVDRVIAKGTRLWVGRATALTAYLRIAGVVGIGGPNRGRTMIDASELDHVPDTLPGGMVEEQYFYKIQVPGTKEVQPISTDLNMNLVEYTRLSLIYDTDEQCNWKIIFRSGAYLLWYGGIESLGMDLQSDQLAKTPVTFVPEGRVTFSATAQQ